MTQGLLRLDLQSLSTHFLPATFENGLALYRSQQVFDCVPAHVNTLEWSLAGTVGAGGKGRSSHEVTAVLETSPGGDVTFFSGTCNCGVSGNCRHSAALAVKASYQAAAEASRQRGANPAPEAMPPAADAAPHAIDLSGPTVPAASSASSASSASRRFPSGPSMDLFGASEPASPGSTPSTAPPAAPEAPPAPPVLRPIPQLHLTATPPALADQRGLLCATLRFDYAGTVHYALHDQNPTRLADDADGRPRWLHRDLEAEHEAHQHLQRLGLNGDPRGQFIRPFVSAAQQQPWLQWLDDGFAELRDAGFAVTIAAELDGWIAHAGALDARLADDAGDLADRGQAGSGGQWFRLSLGMAIGGERRNILPLLPELLAQLGIAVSGQADPGQGPPRHTIAQLQLPPFVYLRQADGSYWRLACEPLRPWLQTLLDIVAERSQAGATLRGAVHADEMRLSRQEALRLGLALQHGAPRGAPSGTSGTSGAPVWQGVPSLEAVLAPLVDHDRLPDVTLPAGLQAQLRPYQLQGLRWLQFLRANDLGGILADDMGLGKTLQTLAHIQCEKEAGRLDKPVLILAPLSLMGNWRREAMRFTPGLRVSVIHGQKRHRAAARMSGCDIVIVPYSLLQRDRSHWLQQAWHLVVLDEAQHIKNASSQAARVVIDLKARHRLCLSGTPMENHLGELWSLFHFLMPGLLGTAPRFRALYRSPIEKQGNTAVLEQLRRRVAPFLLRRTKGEVATDLPPLQEAVASIEFGDGQADLYEAVRLSTEKTVRDALENKGLGASQLQILDALVRLRQVCCDPRLLPATSHVTTAASMPASAKLDWLMDKLPRMIAEGRRVLVFSQFTSMLTLIEEALVREGLPWVKLTGQSQNRDAIVDRFTSGEVPLFLISLKAGGTGLNLPQADTVIHYDPWWNPAIQDQATARAHRIGQTQPVFVYRLVARGTIEERILALQDRKAALAGGLLGEGALATGAGLSDTLLDEGELAALLSPQGG